MIRTILALLTGLLLSLPALAAEPFSAFEATDEKGVPASFQAWHPEYEDNGDYGESWFFYGQGDDGGALFALVSVTNLGLYTFDGSVDLQYYAADGRKWTIHKEYRRGEVNGATDRMDMHVGGAHVWGGGGAYHLTVDESDVTLRLDLANQLPATRFGDGKIHFHEDRSQLYTLGLNTPRAQATGSITVDGNRFDLAGVGYHDHGWATIKLPSFIDKWFTLRVFDQKYTIVLHRQVFSEKYGGAENKFGLIGEAGSIKAATKGFSYTVKSSRKHSSGYGIPTVMQVSINAGGYQISGTVTEARYLDAVDVLAQVSLPIRLAIKAFYTNPILIRSLGQYELDVTHNGVTEHISGVGLVEANYY